MIQRSSNTLSATIGIATNDGHRVGTITKGRRAMLREFYLGFAGYSKPYHMAHLLVVQVVQVVQIIYALMISLDSPGRNIGGGKVTKSRGGPHGCYV